MQHPIGVRCIETSTTTLILRSMVAGGDMRSAAPCANGVSVQPFPTLLGRALAAVGAAGDVPPLSRPHASLPARATRHGTVRP